jgi:hypothetical protein
VYVCVVGVVVVWVGVWGGGSAGATNVQKSSIPIKGREGGEQKVAPYDLFVQHRRGLSYTSNTTPPSCNVIPWFRDGHPPWQA